MDEHEVVLFETMMAVADNPPIVLDVDSADLVSAWLAVRRSVSSIYESLGRPLRIAIDLNSVPRYVALSLLGFGARTGLIDTYSAVYTAARRYETTSGPAAFTEGTWIPRAIPTLGDGASPSARSVMVIAGGFEGEHTRRLVNALEPDRVLVALSTGIDEQHERAARRASAGVAEEYLVDKDGVLYLPSNDMSGCLEVLERALAPIIADPEDPAAVSFVLCGTKVAALAMALYAIEHPVAQVYYSDPERRLESSAAEIAWYTVVRVRL
ncbi:hypothetical protein [Microbacterium murale]|uniref:hypothetical protein n=1 Tax=Microbacterium murale TaxID=1081040 RepID=UPI001662D1DD|nr:hypothetical protein [Microbacterium murale]